MKKEIYLHVPEPCHEDWQAMTPVEQGRFCKSCSKQVTDFSTMTDKEILAVLSKAAGNTCGRFNNGQLERPLAPAVPVSYTPHRIFLSAFIPAFLWAGHGMSQPQLLGKVKMTPVPVECVPTMKGDVQLVVQENVTGKVIDENGNPVENVSVMIEGTRRIAASDKKGASNILLKGMNNTKLRFSSPHFITKELMLVPGQKQLTVTLSRVKEDTVVIAGMVAIRQVSDVAVSPLLITGKVVNELNEPLQGAIIVANNETAEADEKGHFTIHAKPGEEAKYLSASYVGYEPVSVCINNSNDPAAGLTLMLKEKKKLDEVVVVCYATRRRTTMVGGLTMIRTVTMADTLKTMVSKVFKYDLFKVYPNPVTKNSTVSLVFRQPGNYSIQLFDNAGKLYLQKELPAINHKEPLNVALPPALPSGVFFIKAVNMANKKQFINKLVVE